MPSLRWLLLEVCLLSVPLAAQSPPPAPPLPAFEVGVTWVNDMLLSTSNGASVQGTYFFKRSVPRWGGQDYSGITAEFAGTGNASARLYTYQVGWRLGTEWRHFDLYTSLMVGGARVVTWGLSNAGVPVSLVRNSFASSITTTGLDLLLGQHYAVKLIEIDFPIVMVPYPSTGHGSWIGDDRASAGIAYRFGRRQP